MVTENRLRVLHISDLHITENKNDSEKANFDQTVVLDPLIARVEQDYKKGLKPEIVIVTGDIAYKGIEAEYIQAKNFFDELLNVLKLPGERLFIIPGNHDVNRKKYRKSDRLQYDSIKELNDELEDEEHRKDLFRGMGDYFNFVQEKYPHLEGIYDNLVPFVNSYNADCGRKIGIVGLNSSWMCRKSPDEREIAIGEYQIKNAMKELGKMGDVDLAISCFHHPLDWLRPDDRDRCRSYFPDNSVLLCGHLHDAAGGFIKDHIGNFFQFQAGGAYLGSESSWPARFQYITFDWDNDSIRLDFRKFVKDRRIWSLDGETGDDGKKVYTDAGIKKLSEKARVEPSKPQPDKKISDVSEIPNISEKYAGWLSEQCAYMNIEKLQGKGQAIRLSLPEIFIPLYGYEPGRALSKKSGQEDGEIERAGMGERDKAVDIEDLIGKNDYLLLEGQAGSGKTTLLRHLAYRLARGESVQGLEQYLPVLIFLKDLNGIFVKTPDNKRDKLSVRDILVGYFGKDDCIIEPDLLDSFLESGKVLFLLDGLDEMAPENRDIVVNAFSDFRHGHPGNRVVFSGRPHGLTGAAINRFGEKHVRVLSLGMDQVEAFIRRWFSEVYVDSSGMGKRSAEVMIGEIRAHQAIDQLLDNPLMLTAICILYYDGKELPNQRAELYKKFVDNMLYRRFSGAGRAADPEKVREFLMTLAFKMHDQGVRGADRSFAVGVLTGVVKRETDEEEKEYGKRVENLFDEIEPNCGLLKYENGQYNFRHLTFQEFLTATYVVDNSTDYAEAIEKYWDNDRYREVIKLYIGYLSIENRKWANTIVGKIIEKENGTSCARWLLGAGSLMDIHTERRDEDVLKGTRNRLIEIFDREKEPAILLEAGEILGWLGDSRDLREFVPVKGGEYETEKGMVGIEPFEIGKYPVTNRWFEEFVDSGGYGNPGYWSREGIKWRDYKGAKQPLFWNDRKWRCPNSPVVGVSWYEADAFTKWLTESDDRHDYRLLTGIEWEAVASGFAEKRVYPWGDDWEKTRCNNGEINLERITPVGIFRLGNTGEGISDLSGNVWEWTASDYHSGKILNDFKFDKELQRLLNSNKSDQFFKKLEEKNRKLPVLRGGSWDCSSGDCRCAVRGGSHPVCRVDDAGFRCART